jgi:hypothetical protein
VGRRGSRRLSPIVRVVDHLLLLLLEHLIVQDLLVFIICWVLSIC